MEDFRKNSTSSSLSLASHLPRKISANGFDNSKYKYTSVSTANMVPNSSTDDTTTYRLDSQGFLEQQQRPQPWTGMQAPIHSRPRYISETGTDATYLSNCTIDMAGRKDSNNSGSQLLPRFSDERFEDPSYGNRSFSLLRNVYLERKAPIQILLLILLLAFSAVVGTIFVVSFVDNDSKEPNINNDENTMQQDLQLVSKIGATIFEADTSLLLPEPIQPPPIASKLNSILMDAPIVDNEPMTQAVKTNVDKVVAYQYTQTPIHRTTREKRHEPLFESPKETIKYFKITSLSDFANLRSSVDIEAISIEKLVDEINASKKSDNDDSSYNEAIQKFNLPDIHKVKHLKISGPMTEKWVTSVLSKFSYVENLTINVDQLCTGAKVRNRESLKPIRLKNIKSFAIENSHLCEITSWLFKWEMPSIKQLQIDSTDLTKRTFAPVRSFLEKSKNTLNSVVISNSFICSDCLIWDIAFRNMEDIKILNQVEFPLLMNE